MFIKIVIISLTSDKRDSGITPELINITKDTYCDMTSEHRKPAVRKAQYRRLLLDNG
jgi:hypothetical protein